MSLTGEPVALRPLSLGEIFDRAITLYVRNAGILSLIALAIVMPLGIFEYFAGRQNSAALAQILDQIEKGGTSAPPLGAGGHIAMQLSLIAVAAVLSAFAFVSIGAAVAALYRGERPTFAACYGYALRRAGAIFVVLLCQIASLGAGMFAGGMVLGIGVVVDVFAVRASMAAGILLGVLLGVLAIAWVLAMMLCYLAFGFALEALAVERIAAGPAIGCGFARIFNRSELLRAVLITLAFFALYAGVTIVAVSLAAVLESIHLYALYSLAGAAFSIVTTPLFGVLLAVYYFDVRVRREGLDLQMQASALQPLTATP